MALIDTSVLVDQLRGRPEAAAALAAERQQGRLHASEITRLEVMAEMRPAEETRTRRLLDRLVWHPVDTEVAEQAGALARRWRRWRPSHQGIDAADLAIAATAMVHGLRPVTLNVKHFPMFAGLAAPY